MRQSVDALVGYVYPPAHGGIAAVVRLIFIFCVRLLLFARSTKMGNAKASTSGADKKYRFSHFLHIVTP